MRKLTGYLRAAGRVLRQWRSQLAWSGVAVWLLSDIVVRFTLEANTIGEIIAAYGRLADNAFVQSALLGCACYLFWSAGNKVSERVKSEADREIERINAVAEKIGDSLSESIQKYERWIGALHSFYAAERNVELAEQRLKGPLQAADAIQRKVEALTPRPPVGDWYDLDDVLTKMGDWKGDFLSLLVMPSDFNLDACLDVDLDEIFRTPAPGVENLPEQFQANYRRFSSQVAAIRRRLVEYRRLQAEAAKRARTTIENQRC